MTYQKRQNKICIRRNPFFNSCVVRLGGTTMNLSWAALLALAITPAALLASEGTFDKTLPVSGAVNLNVGTGSGYIHITPGF